MIYTNAPKRNRSAISPQHSAQDLPLERRLRTSKVAQAQMPQVTPRAQVSPGVRPLPAIPQRTRLRLADLLHPAPCTAPRGVGETQGYQGAQPYQANASGAVQAQGPESMAITGWQPHTTMPGLATNPYGLPSTGMKFKFDAAAMRKAGIPEDADLSHLISWQTGLGLILTPTLNRGSYGKVRLARGDDGSLLAVKEMRTIAKSGVNKHDRPHTHPLSTRKIMQEAADTQGLRTIIDSGMAYYDAPNAPWGQRLCGVRQNPYPFVVLDVVQVPHTGKVFMVMTREASDMQVLSESLPHDLRPFASLSLAAQGFSELAFLHDRAHVAHLDIKLENFLFNAGGQMRLVDFGLSGPLRFGQSPYAGRHGSLLSPEMLLADSQDPTQYMSLGSANDVWAMAASVMALSTRTPWEATFFDWPNAKGVQRNQKAFAMFDAFSKWQDTLSPAPGAAMMPIRISPDDFFGRQFYDLAQSQPALCGILLNDAFALDPQMRRPAAEIAAKIRQLLPDQDCIAAQMLREEMAAIDEGENDLQYMREKTSKFAAWVQAQPQVVAPPASWLGARPVPGA